MTEDLLPFFLFFPLLPSFRQKCSVRKMQPCIPGAHGLTLPALGGRLFSGQSGKEKLGSEGDRIQAVLRVLVN